MLLTGLTVVEQQRQLADALGRKAPISRSALLEWKKGRVPVPMEAFTAACGLADRDPVEVWLLADGGVADALRRQVV